MLGGVKKYEVFRMRTTLLILGAMATFAFVPTHLDAQGGILCDEFSLQTVLQGNTLQVKIATDLPDDAIISVKVTRSYREKGNSEEYAREYFNEESTVGRWREMRDIDVTAGIFEDSLHSHRAEMTKMGLGFEVGRISADIEVRAILPINGQTNPNFGTRNSDLNGKAVTQESYGNLVTAEKKIAKEL
jgi:hypothetical protein